MYEEMTYETILESMLATALAQNPKLDSREGSILWLGQAPAAVELTNLYLALDEVLNQTFADTAARAYLIRRAAERGLEPYAASAAVLELTVTPADLALEAGTRFSVGDLNYYISEDYGDGVYALTCETAGAAGSDCSGSCFPVEDISGLLTCTITALLIPGEDEEATEDFRARYLASLQTTAFGGNRADYLEAIGAISGVGAVKLYRAWNGGISAADLVPPDGTEDWIAALETAGETDSEILTWLQNLYTQAAAGLLTAGGAVRAVLLDADYAAPSETLLALVQETLDPVEYAGEGYGLAPIGHVVLVEGAAEEAMDIACTLTPADGYAVDDAMLEAVTAQIDSYLLELRQAWADADALVVRLSRLEAQILEAEGVLDVTDLTLNGGTENCMLDADSVPVTGALTVTAA